MIDLVKSVFQEENEETLIQTAYVAEQKKLHVERAQNFIHDYYLERMEKQKYVEENLFA